jgi:hypothetical protein
MVIMLLAAGDPLLVEYSPLISNFHHYFGLGRPELGHGFRF